MRLLLISVLGLNCFFSLSCMHLIVRPLNTLSKIKKSRSYCTSSEGVKNRFVNNTLINKNFLAALGNIAAYATTSNSLMLLPLGSHIAHQATFNVITQEQKKESQIQEDLSFFIQHNPTLISNINTLKKIRREIDLLDDQYFSIINKESCGKEYIPRELTFSARNIHNTRYALNHKKTKLEHSIITDTASFFNVYKTIDIAECITESEKSLKYHQHLATLGRVSRMISMPLAIVPRLWKEAGHSTNCSETVLNISTATLFTFIEYIIIHHSLIHTPSLAFGSLASLGLSTYVSYKNIHEASTLIEKINQKCTHLAYGIEILQLQKMYNEKYS